MKRTKETCYFCGYNGPRGCFEYTCMPNENLIAICDICGSSLTISSFTAWLGKPDGFSESTCMIDDTVWETSKHISAVGNYILDALKNTEKEKCDDE